MREIRLKRFSENPLHHSSAMKFRRNIKIIQTSGLTPRPKKSFVFFSCFDLNPSSKPCIRIFYHLTLASDIMERQVSWNIFRQWSLEVWEKTSPVSLDASLQTAVAIFLLKLVTFSTLYLHSLWLITKEIRRTWSLVAIFLKRLQSKPVHK